MGMSYKRAWELLAALNTMFEEPVAVTLPGNNVGAGTQLTPFGERVIALYRAVERRANQAAAASVQELVAAAAPAQAAAPAPARTTGAHKREVKHALRPAAESARRSPRKRA
jgi:molybdate transport system regulatory protein